MFLRMVGEYGPWLPVIFSFSPPPNVSTLSEINPLIHITINSLPHNPDFNDLLNPLSDDKILDWFRFKRIADDISECI